METENGTEVPQKHKEGGSIVMAMLEVKNLGISFGGLRAVDDFHISIEKGQLYGLIGPNGAGKTTVFNMLTGVYTPDEGTISLDGADITGKKTIDINKAGIARTFQNIRLFKDQSVLDNVKIGLHNQMSYSTLTGILRLPKYRKVEAEMDEKAMELLKVFDLEREAGFLSSNLPYGKQRKLEIARALATNPKLLLLDEPAAGMNPNETKELMETIHFVRDEFDMTILLIEHDMKLVSGICEKLTVLNFGQVLAEGATGDVLHDPQVIKEYLGERHEIDGGTTMAMLEVKNLKVHYGVIQAIKGISFEVNEGEVIALIGANGAGKTTTLQTITGMLKPSEGEILFEGQDIVKVPGHKIVSMGMAHVPEGRRVFAELSVYENLKLGAYTRKDKNEIAESLAKVYKSFPRLEERKNQLAGTLSGGEQQMLAMGRALMSKPKIILMDEPSMGLSPIFVEEIFHIIREISASGTTVLLVEQNAKKALAIANRAYVLETGNIVLSGDAKEMMNNDSIKKAYLGE